MTKKWRWFLPYRAGEGAEFDWSSDTFLCLTLRSVTAFKTLGCWGLLLYEPTRCRIRYVTLFRFVWRCALTPFTGGRNLWGTAKPGCAQMQYATAAPDDRKIHRDNEPKYKCYILDIIAVRGKFWVRMEFANILRCNIRTCFLFFLYES